MTQLKRTFGTKKWPNDDGVFSHQLQVSLGSIVHGTLRARLADELRVAFGVAAFVREHFSSGTRDIENSLKQRTTSTLHVRGEGR